MQFLLNFLTTFFSKAIKSALLRKNYSCYQIVLILIEKTKFG